MEKVSSLASYSDLFDRIQSPGFIVDSSGKVLEFNTFSEGFFNLKESECYLFNISIFFESEEDMEKELRIAQRRYHPRSKNKSIFIGDKEKHLIIETCCLELKDKEEKVIQILIKDQTELVELQRSLEEKNKELSLISITDKLTDLYNRRYFDDTLEKEIGRTQRSGSSMSLIIFDVDKFKVFNDTNGHSAGDSLLTELAKVIKGNIRGSDVACRYGGEEFTIICPDTTPEQAYILAERIRYAVKNHPFLHREKQPFGFVSVSIGIANYPGHTTNSKKLLEMADSALYLSKENGRNQTTVFQEEVNSESI